MARENYMSIPAHNNIYTSEHNYRNLDIYFSEPEKGVNNATGLLLLIPGFGANPQSNIYKKMRLKLADKYNLTVIQCNYFGSQYMQSSKRVVFLDDYEQFRDIVSEHDLKLLKSENTSFESKLKTLSNYSCLLRVSEVLGEDEASFNDMGFMQAMDLLTSLAAVKLIFKDNNLAFNEEKIIAYGHSHGAYLAYLCNRLSPHEFSLIIDNSAWLEPVYLTASRYLNQSIGKMTVQIQFDYLAGKLNYDKNILKLTNLYKNFKNTALICSFHGTTDNLVNYKDKKTFCNNVDHLFFHLIGEKEIDNEKFFSSGHGLQADFLKLFDFIMNNVDSISKPKNITNDKLTLIKSKGVTYKIDFSHGLPVMTV